MSLYIITNIIRKSAVNCNCGNQALKVRVCVMKQCPTSCFVKNIIFEKLALALNITASEQDGNH